MPSAIETIRPSVTVIVDGPLASPAASVTTEPAWMSVVSAWPTAGATMAIDAKRADK